LRKLLKPEPEVQIINIHGTGYRFLLPGTTLESLSEEEEVVGEEPVE